MNRSRRELEVLLRRAGFGGSGAELAGAVKAGWAATVDRLLDFSVADVADGVAVPTLELPGLEPIDLAARRAAQAQRNVEAQRLRLWWLDRMVTTSVPLREKLTFLWHGHFATALSKVQFPSLMYRQNQLFRELGSGDFAVLTDAVAKDPAMLLWLDSNTNVKAHPNENFARELMELFTLGIGNYTERDVTEAARAFTGWSYDRVTNAFVLRVAQHDPSSKTVLGQTGTFVGEDVIRLATTSSISARFVTAKLWSHFAYPIGPSDPLVASLAARFAANLDISELVRAILMHPHFRTLQTRTGLVKQPIEYVVGTLRALGLRADDPKLLTQLSALGQLPFEPPSVGGWPQNTYWLSTATALARFEFATAISARADLSAIERLRAKNRPDAAARMLGITRWSQTTHRALGRVAHDPRSVLTLAITAPEYVLN
jgi:uncharacterized protein (DUF1800 family)